MAKIQPAGKIIAKGPLSQTAVGKITQQIGLEPSVRQVQQQQKEQEAQQAEIAFAQSILSETAYSEKTEEVPDWSKLPRRFERKWSKLSNISKRKLLEKWRREGKTKMVVTKIGKDPLASYETQYAKLSPTQQSYFQTPTQVRQQVAAERTAKIAKEQKRADEQIASYASRLKSAEEKLEKLRQRESETGKDYSSSIRKYKDDIYEYKKNISYLQTAKSKYISQGVSFSAAENWATSKTQASIKRGEIKRAEKKATERRIGFVPGITTGTITTTSPVAQGIKITDFRDGDSMITRTVGGTIVSETIRKETIKKIEEPKIKIKNPLEAIPLITKTTGRALYQKAKERESILESPAKQRFLTKEQTEYKFTQVIDGKTVSSSIIIPPTDITIDTGKTVRELRDKQNPFGFLFAEVDSPGRKANIAFEKAQREQVIEPIEKKYKDKYEALLLRQNKEALDKGEITLEVAISRTNRSAEYKQLNKEYKEEVSESLKIQNLPADVRLKKLSTVASSIYPSTLGEVALISTLPFAKLGKSSITALRGTGTFITSKPIVGAANIIYEDLLPTPKSESAKFLKASAYSLALPKFGVKAYGAEIGKGLVLSPGKTTKELTEFAIKSPGEFLGFGFGARALKIVPRVAEVGLRYRSRAKIETVKTDYGEITTFDVPKIGKVAWVEGAFAQTEKVKIGEQIKRQTGVAPRLFTSVTPKGFSYERFKSRKGVGFEVRQMTKPGRGFYEAPEFKFLEKYYKEVGTTRGAASYYGEFTRERLPQIPKNIFDFVLGEADVKRGRTTLFTRGTLKGVPTPQWIKNIAEGKPLSRKQKATREKLYQEFLEEPIEFGGKTYKGAAKLELQRLKNLKGLGTPSQLKSYAAIMQFQAKTKRSLPGGPEILSGIAPYGAESQIITPIGVRYFPKQLKDLRKSIKERGPLLNLKNIGTKLTDIRRGQSFAFLGGKIIEIQPVRAFTGRPFKKAKPTSKTISEIANLPKNIKSLGKKGQPVERIRRQRTISERPGITRTRFERPTRDTFRRNDFRRTMIPTITRERIRDRPFSERLREPTRTREPTRIREPFRTREPTRIREPFRTRDSGTPRTPFRPKEPINPPIIFVNNFERATKQKQTAYYPEAKAKGGKKFIRLSKNAVSKEQALDIGSRAVDETTAQTFRIVPSKKKLPPPQMGGMDWALRQRKFRPYKIRRKAKIGLGNTYIERRNAAIDTPGEVKGLSLSKYLKGRRGFF